MAHEFKLSEIGLKLIKAYEGFRPIETTLVSGQSVIGYGHKYSPDEEAVISREKAEDILKEDLEPYEAMINESIFAPLTQSQFDALVSLSYNIGPRAFLSSNVLHALNNGRPLEAASGFDEWRKSVIDGKTYVVDALVRRRTAEKALFLRPIEGVIAAPRNEIPPKSDTSYKKNTSATPVYGRLETSGIVMRAPYDQSDQLTESEIADRRREDGPAGSLTLSEISDEQEVHPLKAEDIVSMPETVVDDAEDDKNLSPIALAAAEVSERLDALIGDQANVQADASSKEIETIEPIEVQTPTDLPVAQEVVQDVPEVEEYVPQPANDGTRDDYRRPGRHKSAQAKSPEVYIQPTQSTPVAPEADSGAYWSALILGATLLGGGAAKWFMTPRGQLDEISAFLAPVATIVGAMIVLGALYYMLKRMARAE